MIGLGFAGVGWLGESLIKELPKFSSRLRLAAVQDARVDVAAHVAERYGSPWFGSAYEEMLGLPSVDAVVICTPNALHVPQAQAAFHRGKHVLVQKPLALSAADAAATVAVAERYGRLLFVDYTYRFLETTAALSAGAARGHGLRAVFHNIYGPGADKAWTLDPKLSGGGALVDLGVHLLDLALWLVRPARVELVSSWLDQRPIDRAARLEVLLDGAPLQLEVSWNAPLAATEIALEVTDGTRWQNVDGSFFHFRTLADGAVLADQETTLREDTLRAFCQSVDTNEAPSVDLRVYELLDRAYGRA